MPSDTDFLKKLRSLFIISGFVILFILGYGCYRIVEFNNKEMSFSSASEDKGLSLVINSGTNQNEKWETVIQVSENPEDKQFFTGETSSCIITNNKKNDLSEWTLTIPVKQECYLNGFWCGDFEVHQFRENQEIVEVINNSQEDFSNLKLECNKYSTNLMVHLLPGDFLIYHPSEEAKEDVIKANSSIGIGFIFYYQNAVDFSDYKFVYQNNLKFMQSDSFKIVIWIILIWLLGVTFLHVVLLTQKKYASDMSNSIKSISFMADLYHEVHMINLASDTGYLIKGDQKSLMFNFLGTKVTAYFKKYIEEDCKEEYKNDLAAFLNLNSVSDIMQNVSSIAFEYESKSNGWCSLRFFKIEKDRKIIQLIFTVQDINEEKLKSQHEQERIMQNEYAQIVRNSFLGTIAYSTESILNDVLATNQQILNLLKNDEEKALPAKITGSIEHLRILQQCVSDMHDIETNSLQVATEKYNPNEVINQLLLILKPHYEGKAFEFQKNIAPDIPDCLEGDKKRLMEILLLLLFSALFITQKGFVKFSIFAKQKEDVEELLFSIRDSGTGFTEEQMKEVYSFLGGEKINSFDNPSLVYLKIIDSILRKMGSELKIVSEFGSGTEFYFTLKQKILEQ